MTHEFGFPPGGGSGITPTLAQVLAAGDNAGGFNITNLENLAVHQISNKTGTGQFYFDAPGMVMQTGIDCSGYDTNNMGLLFSSLNPPFNIDVKNSIFYSGGSQSLDFVNRRALDSLNQISIDWANLQLAVSGTLAFEWSNPSGLRYYSGDNGGAPANPVTPAKYLLMFDVNNTPGYIPIFQ